MPPIRTDRPKNENGPMNVPLFGNTLRDWSSPTEPDLTRASTVGNPPDAQSSSSLLDLPDPLQACTILRGLGWVDDAKELLGAYTRYKHFMELLASGELQKLEPRTPSQGVDPGPTQQRSNPYPTPPKTTPPQILNPRNPRSPRRYPPPARFSPYPQAQPHPRRNNPTIHHHRPPPQPQLIPIPGPRPSSSTEILHDIRAYLHGAFALEDTSPRQSISVSRHGAYLRWSHRHTINPCTDALDAAMRVSRTWVMPTRNINSGVFLEGIILRLAARERYQLCCGVCAAPQNCHTNFFQMDVQKLDDVTQSLMACLSEGCTWVLQGGSVGAAGAGAGAQRYGPALWRLLPRVADRLEGVCRRVLWE